MSKSALEFSFLKKQSFQLFLIVLVPIVFVIASYSYGWYQSRFKCLNFVQPLIYPFIAAEQVNGCMVFADLSNYRADVTNKQVNDIIQIMAKTGQKIDANEAYKYAFGRAKIAQFAKMNNISLTEEEVDKAVADATKEAGSLAKFLGNKTPDERRDEVSGYLLQKKVEDKAVAYLYADTADIRWDWVKDEIWQPKKAELQAEAKAKLEQVKANVEGGLNVEEAVKGVEVDTSKFSFQNFSDVTWAKDSTPKDYQKVFAFSKGVSEVLCDDRQCIILNIEKVNNGAYDSMEEFFGGLKGW